jgi:3-deoxy-7-phosphoheptulonate synthase
VVIVLDKNITREDAAAILLRLEGYGLKNHAVHLNGQSVITVSNFPADFDIRKIQLIDGVKEVVEVSEPYKLASKSWKKERTSFNVNGTPVGTDTINVMAGPCAVESEKQIFEIAEFLHQQNIKFIRGGAYKPRTSPYSFQGLGLEGLKMLRAAADKYQLNVITEVIDLSVLDEVYKYADVLQIGTRNMQNYYLLAELGKQDKPVLLKRGMQAKIPEWLMAAEYILSGGNERVILCERGIRTFDNSTRNTLDIGAIPLVKELSHLPVFADPSHGTGIRTRVEPLALAAVAAGADGLLIEVHNHPDQALSDGPQSIYPDQLVQLMNKLSPLAQVIGRKLDYESQNNYFSAESAQ